MVYPRDTSVWCGHVLAVLNSASCRHSRDALQPSSQVVQLSSPCSKRGESASLTLHFLAALDDNVAAGETGVIVRAALQWSDAAASLCTLLSLMTSQADGAISDSSPEAGPHTMPLKGNSMADGGSNSSSPPPKRQKSSATADHGPLSAAWQQVSRIAELGGRPSMESGHLPARHENGLPDQQAHSAAAAETSEAGASSQSVWGSLAAACQVHQPASPTAASLSSAWDDVLDPHLRSQARDAISDTISGPGQATVVSAAAVNCLRHSVELHLVRTKDIACCLHACHSCCSRHVTHQAECMHAIVYSSLMHQHRPCNQMI